MTTSDKHHLFGLIYLIVALQCFAASSTVLHILGCLFAVLSVVKNILTISTKYSSDIDNKTTTEKINDNDTNNN